MTPRAKGIAVLAVQLLLVLSVAAKYAWERHACPRVWTRTGQVDPELPLRGRYLALHLAVDACGLKEGEEGEDTIFLQRQWTSVPTQDWNVKLIAKHGKLTAVGEKRAPETERLLLRKGMPCEYGLLSSTTDFFIAEHAKPPFPLKPGHELWAEVTVPPQGPPRPIHLAISDSTGFHVLDLK